MQEKNVKVWDPLVRMGHWGLVLCFFTAFVVEDHWLDLHVLAGYGALGIVGIRLLWGLIGSRHARFGDFVRPPAVVTTYLRDVVTFRARRHLGHNPAGGAMVLALLAAAALTGLTGLATYGATEFSGPFAGWSAGFGPRLGNVVESVHESLANLTLWLVVLHVAGVLLASLQHRENLVRAMFTGRKRTYQPEEKEHV